MTPLHITLTVPQVLELAFAVGFLGWIAYSLVSHKHRQQGYKAGKVAAIEEIRGLARRSRGNT